MPHAQVFAKLPEVIEVLGGTQVSVEEATMLADCFLNMCRVGMSLVPVPIAHTFTSNAYTLLCVVLTGPFLGDEHFIRTRTRDPDHRLKVLTRTALTSPLQSLVESSRSCRWSIRPILIVPVSGSASSGCWQSMALPLMKTVCAPSNSSSAMPRPLSPAPDP